MKEQLKLFIEANSNLLESGDFEELYDITPVFCRADLKNRSRNPNPFRGWDECDK